MRRIQLSKPLLIATFSFAIVFSFYSNTTFAQEAATWTRFLGDNGTAVLDDQVTPPTEWTPEANYKWSTPLPGKGWSSPVYADGRIWLTSAVAKEATPEEIKAKLAGDRMARIKTAAAAVEFHALCVDLETGELLHDVVLGESSDPDPINPMNSYASPTCVIADGKVVCHFGNYGTWCLDAVSGEEFWEQQFEVKYSVGPGSSPVVVGSNVILVCDGTDQQFIVAVNLSSGEQVWKTDRPPLRTDEGEFRKAYCTPTIAELDGRVQAIIPGAQWICGYDPETGEELWRFDYGHGYSVTPVPVVLDGLIIFATGYDSLEFVALRVEGSGELPESAAVWRSNGAPSMASFVSRDGMIFATSDRGALQAISVETGEEVAKVRMLANVSASPLLAGGNLYIANRDGEMTVVRCDKTMEVVSTFKFGQAILASPCVIGNDLIVRTGTDLIRISAEK